MNGGSFEVVAPTDGQYGSVAISPFAFESFYRTELFVCLIIDLLTHTRGRSYGRNP